MKQTVNRELMDKVMNVIHHPDNRFYHLKQIRRYLDFAEKQMNPRERVIMNLNWLGMLNSRFNCGKV